MLTRRHFLTQAAWGVLAGIVPLRPPFAHAGIICPDFGQIRMGVIADLHTTRQGRDGLLMSAHSLRCLKKSVAALNRHQELDLVIVAGDLLFDGEWENAQLVKEDLDRLHAPYFVVPGNHDYGPLQVKRRRSGYSYMNIAEFADFFQGHGFKDSRNRYWAHTIRPGVRLIGLDSCLPDEDTRGGRISEAQLKWLNHQLCSYPNTLHIIVLHHNVIRWSANEQRGGPATWYCIDNDLELRNLLSQHKKTATIVLSGHRHIGLHTRCMNGVCYFTLPSINSYPLSYTLFTLSRQEVAWETSKVSVCRDVHQQAKENLLKACQAGGEWLPGDTGCGQDLLDFYEHSAMQSGKYLLNCKHSHASHLRSGLFARMGIR